MKNFPVLESERLHLVHIAPSYAEDLYDILSRDEVTQYYGVESLNSYEEAVELIEQIHTLFLRGQSIRWGLVLKESGHLIGTVGLNNIHYWNKKAEISYELHPSYWRKKLMSEAVLHVLEYAFEELELYRIGAVTYPENIPSIRLLKKMGFQKEGVLRGYLRQNFQSHDIIMHSLLKPDWQELKEKINTEKDKIRSIRQRERKLFKLSQPSIPPEWTILAKEIHILKEEIQRLDGRDRRKKEKILKKKLKIYQQICPPLYRNRLLMK